MAEKQSDSGVISVVSGVPKKKRYVYFIATQDRKVVKIGYTNNLPSMGV